MSRKPRNPEPLPQEIAQQQQVMSTLMRCAAGTLPVDKSTFDELLILLLRLCEFGGEFHGAPCAPVSYFPWFKPHLRDAERAKNDSLLALLTLALLLIRQFELHMPQYVAKIRGQQQTGRTSAKKRRDEEKRVRTCIEAWERENNRPLSPKSPVDDITNCAATYDLSETTIKNALYLRERQRRAAPRG